MQISATDAEIGEDSFGIYYPTDGRLFTGYGRAEEAEDRILGMSNVFPDAFVVRVRIERV